MAAKDLGLGQGMIRVEHVLGAIFTACHLGTWYNLQRHAPSDLFPPTRPHLLKFSEPPETVPPAGDQVNNMEPAKDISNSKPKEHPGV